MQRLMVADVVQNILSAYDLSCHFPFMLCQSLGHSLLQDLFCIATADNTCGTYSQRSNTFNGTGK